MGEWEEIHKNTHKWELEKNGLEKGISPFMWTEDFDLRKWGFETEDEQPFIRYGLTNDDTLRKWLNVFAVRNWEVTVNPDYVEPPDPEKTEEDIAKQDAVWTKIRERYLSRKASKSGEMANFGF